MIGPLEEEIEALKWIARRKEMEWDCARQLILQKKLDIKVVKRKINMVKTLNDLGPQVNVDSDDEDTPFEDDDDSSSDEIGKKHALKKYDQFALNTSCFYLSCAISRNFCYKNNE